MYQYFKRQLKTPTCFGSFVVHPQGVLNVLHWNYLRCFVCVVGVWQCEIWTVIWNGMSNLYSIVPKLLTWIIIDEVDLDLPCGVCAWCGELKTTVRGSSLFSTRRTRNTHHRSKFHAAKHRLRTQNFSSNFSEARLILPEDGSQRIRNISEFLIIL
jgi:hypothetical protein